MRGTLLFGHGARNAEYVQPFERIRAAMLMQAPTAIVEIGFLELSQPSFESALDALRGRGVTEVSVVPIFFAPGRHVLKDLPQLVANALDRCPGLRIEIASCVGEVPDVIAAMADFALGTQAGGASG